MRLLPECYACALRQAASAARLVSDDERFHHRCLAEASRILADTDPTLTPPEVGEHVYRMVRELSGDPDPFRAQKQQQNAAVLELLPWLRDTVAQAPDPVEMAVRLAIAGNAVDPGAQQSFDLEKSIDEALGREGELAGYPALSQALAGAARVLVVADNCGEIVCDRVLVETVQDRHGVEAAVAVRGGPIINDATEREAAEVGMPEVCGVISSGMEMPGTVLARTTPEFRDAFASADVVISKGQGNWETLEGCGREVFFLLQAKCPAVAAINRCAEGAALLIHQP